VLVAGLGKTDSRFLTAYLSCIEKGEVVVVLSIPDFALCQRLSSRLRSQFIRSQGVFRSRLGHPKRNPPIRAGFFFFWLPGDAYVAFRLIQPSRPKAEPNSQTDAGTGMTADGGAIQSLHSPFSCPIPFGSQGTVALPVSIICAAARNGPFVDNGLRLGDDKKLNEFAINVLVVSVMV
jgi:hypothetical protein